MPIRVAARSATTRMLGLRVRFPLGHGCLSVLSIVYCQIEVSETGRSFVQGNPAKCGVPECDLETSTSGMPRPPWAFEPRKKGHEGIWGNGSVAPHVLNLVISRR